MLQDDLSINPIWLRLCGHGLLQMGGYLTGFLLLLYCSLALGTSIPIGLHWILAVVIVFSGCWDISHLCIAKAALMPPLEGGIPLPPDHFPTWPMCSPPPSPVACQWRQPLSLHHHHGNPLHIRVLPVEYLGDGIDSPFGMEEVALLVVW